MNLVDQKYHQDPPGLGRGVLPNMREITIEQGSRSPFFSYTPVAIGYRQIAAKDMRDADLKPSRYGTTDQHTPINWFQFADGNGYALAAEHWNKRVRIFKWAVCEHKYTERNVGRCLTERTCDNCGRKETIDSSD